MTIGVLFSLVSTKIDGTGFDGYQGHLFFQKATYVDDPSGWRTQALLEGVLQIAMARIWPTVSKGIVSPGV